MHELHLIGEVFEIEGDPHAKGGGGAEKAIQLHERHPTGGWRNLSARRRDGEPAGASQPCENQPSARKSARADDSDKLVAPAVLAAAVARRDRAGDLVAVDLAERSSLEELLGLAISGSDRRARSE